MSDNETSHGYKRPPFRGSVYGQTITCDKKVPTGKRFPMDMPDGRTIWVRVMETRNIAVWVWNGDAWITGEDWDVLHAATQRAAAGTKFPSKRDLNRFGEPMTKYATKPIAKPKRK